MRLGRDPAVDVPGSRQIANKAVQSFAIIQFKFFPFRPRFTPQAKLRGGLPAF
jgi:hypothetical protein